MGAFPAPASLLGSESAASDGERSRVPRSSLCGVGDRAATRAASGVGNASRFRTRAEVHQWRPCRDPKCHASAAGCLGPKAREARLSAKLGKPSVYADEKPRTARPLLGLNPKILSSHKRVPVWNGAMAHAVHRSLERANASVFDHESLCWKVSFPPVHIGTPLARPAAHSQHTA